MKLGAQSHPILSMISHLVVHWHYTLGLEKISWWQLEYCIKFHSFALPWEVVPKVFPIPMPSLIYISRPLRKKRKQNKGTSFRCILGVMYVGRVQQLRIELSYFKLGCNLSHFLSFKFWFSKLTQLWCIYSHWQLSIFEIFFNIPF